MSLETSKKRNLTQMKVTETDASPPKTAKRRVLFPEIIPVLVPAKVQNGSGCESDRQSESEIKSDSEDSETEEEVELEPYDIELIIQYFQRTLSESLNIAMKNFGKRIASIVRKYADCRRSQSLNALLKAIQLRNVEICRFKNKRIASLGNIAVLHISDFIFSSEMLPGFAAMRNIQSFRIGMVEYNEYDDITESDMIETFESWENLKSLEMWNLNEDCGSRYDGSIQSKAWTETLLSASSQSLQRLQVAFYGKELTQSMSDTECVFPSLDAIDPPNTTLKKCELWIRDDNIDIMSEWCESLTKCTRLKTIVIEFAAEMDNDDSSDPDWSFCKPIANMCADALFNSGLASKADQDDIDSGLGNLTFRLARGLSVAAITKPEFWDESKRRTQLNSLIFQDYGDIVEEASVKIKDLSAQMKLLMACGIVGTACKIYTFQGEEMCSVMCRSENESDQSENNSDRSDKEKSVEEEGTDEEEKDNSNDKASVIAERLTQWLQYIPEKLKETGLDSNEKLYEMDKKELGDVCRALNINPGGRRLDLVLRVLAFKPSDRNKAIYNEDTEIDSDDEYDSTECLNIGTLINMMFAGAI